MTKLEQMQERAREIMFQYFDELESCETVDQRITCKEHAEYWLTNLTTEVWNEAIKECEGCVPEEDDGISPDTGMPQYLDFNKGITQGWNDCRNQTLQAISKLRVWQ